MLILGKGEMEVEYGIFKNVLKEEFAKNNNLDIEHPYRRDRDKGGYNTNLSVDEIIKKIEENTKVNYQVKLDNCSYYGAFDSVCEKLRMIINISENDMVGNGIIIPTSINSANTIISVCNLSGKDLELKAYNGDIKVGEIDYYSNRGVLSVDFSSDVRYSTVKINNREGAKDFGKVVAYFGVRQLAFVESIDYDSIILRGDYIRVNEVLSMHDKLRDVLSRCLGIKLLSNCVLKIKEASNKSGVSLVVDDKYSFDILNTTLDDLCKNDELLNELTEISYYPDKR